LPDSIEIDISELTIGMFVYIKDLKSDKYSFLAPDNSVVVGVKTARAAIEEEVEEEGVEGEEGEEGTPSEASGDQPTDTAKEDK
jgi:large subunit ribosomal protein L25